MRHSFDGGATSSGSIGREVVAGLMVFILQLVQAGSFVALIFQGDASAGFAWGLWSSLVGIAVASAIVALGTSLPPLATSPDTPSLAVTAAVAAALSANAVASGHEPRAAAVHVILALTMATAVGGAAMLALGALRLGRAIRFLPYAVVAGFLAATGYLIMLGGAKVVLGAPLALETLSKPPSREAILRAAVAISFVGSLIVSRGLVRSPLLLPGMVVAFTATIDGICTSCLGSDGWFLAAARKPEPWLPWIEIGRTNIDWPLLLNAVADIATIALVTLISIVVKTATVELSRATPADLDRELVTHGAAHLLAAPLGGLAISLSPGNSRLAKEAGASRTLFGIVSGAAALATLGASFNLLALVPTPVLGGLLVFLGFTLIADALKATLRQKAWLELGVAAVIMLACITHGYVVGIVAGLAVSCLLFAVSYARSGVIRRQLGRDRYPGFVTRSTTANELLLERGSAIQIYWLSGYLFFGSSEQVFENVRNLLAASHPEPVRFIILDFSDVNWADAAARASIVMLNSYCKRHGIRLLASGLSARLKVTLAASGLEEDLIFATHEQALAWSEEHMLSGLEGTGEGRDIHAWLVRRFGGERAATTLLKYAVRVDVKPGEIIYRAGDPSDSIDIVASGTLLVDVPAIEGGRHVVRQMQRETIVGEMGYFRKRPRSATISAETGSVVFCLRRENMRKLELEQPWLAIAVYRFVVEELAGRLELANRQTSALN